MNTGKCFQKATLTLQLMLSQQLPEIFVGGYHQSDLFLPQP